MRQHKVIGLVGGMSWESSALYYRLINEAMQRRLGGHHNAVSVLYTLDFAELVEAGAAGRWDEVAAAISRAGEALERAGADFMLITANAAHAVADQVAGRVRLPVVHIGAPIARALGAAGVRRAALVGTRHVTQSDWYAEWLRAHAQVQIDTPSAEECAELDRIIFEELTHGRIEPRSRSRYFEILAALERRGAEAVVVACTELPLLTEAHPPPVRCLDSTRLHAERAVDLALES